MKCKICGHDQFHQEDRVLTCTNCFVSKTPEEWDDMTEQEVLSFREVIEAQNENRLNFANLTDSEYEFVLARQKMKLHILRISKAVRSNL